MKKLCLILTVLYAIWANCSAQSLNIATNLLEGNSSTFDSGWGNWGDQGSHFGKSLASGDGPDGSQCARLTPQANATENYNAQLRYTYAATQGTTYVFRLKAKRVSGNGTIQAIMQHNATPYEQKAFFEANVTGDWATYEGEVTADRDDYNVIMINYGLCGEVLIDDIEFGVKTDNVARTINVDGKTRKYWLYVPASVAGKTNVPVIFSLHGRQDKGADPDKTDAPKFKDIADTKGVIIVYPQGRNGNDQDYPNRTENGKEVAWNSGYAGNNYGWEATGQENADTKFIQALVDELKKNNFYGSTTVDPTRFYLCGFSMGGMMTYACAKVLNGTFAAYGSCSGFPLNEFHLNLATKQPVPFMHLHGDADGIVGINHLHTIIENLLFRNGCNLKDFATTDKWEEASYNGSKYNYKKYDFTGVKDVPVTTVTFKDLEHVVHASAPQYLWDFFSPKTLDSYQTTTMKWQWDMKTINSNLSASNGYPYGWERVAVSETTHGTLTYGNNRKGNCSIQGCIGATNGCNGNHNVYN